MSRGAVGEQAQLLLFDAILHLTAGTIELLVKLLGAPLLAGQRGHDEPRVGTFGQVLGFANDAPLPGPALLGPVDKILEYTRRLARLLEQRTGLRQLTPESSLKASIARQTKDKVHAV